MTDKELAEAVVALGVGEQYGRYYEIGEDQERPQADGFVRDWRVAGALMEKCPTGSWILMDNDKWHGAAYRKASSNESLPRAITEACVDALSE